MDVPIQPPKLIGVNPTEVAAMEAELRKSLERMKAAVGQFELQKFDKLAFTKDFEAAVNDVAGVVSKFPSISWDPFRGEVGSTRYLGLPSLDDPPIEVRLPTLAEIRSDKGWSDYIAQRRRFFAAKGIYATGEVRGVLEGKLRTKLTEDQTKGILQVLVELRKAQDDFIRSMSP